MVLAPQKIDRDGTRKLERARESTVINTFSKMILGSTDIQQHHHSFREAIMPALSPTPLSRAISHLIWPFVSSLIFHSVMFSMILLLVALNFIHEMAIHRSAPSTSFSQMMDRECVCVWEKRCTLVLLLCVSFDSVSLLLFIALTLKCYKQLSWACANAKHRHNYTPLTTIEDRRPTQQNQLIAPKLKS